MKMGEKKTGLRAFFDQKQEGMPWLGRWMPRLTQSLKIALAALAAIALAGRLGLKYSATAGIITVLSIGNTKRETLKSALRRGMAFGCALLLGGACFGLLGFTLPAFATYLFLFALVCMTAGWGEAIAMDSVLITHFLGEGSMELPLIGNEILLFLIGVSFGILVNLHLHRKSGEFTSLSDEVDDQMKGILHRMSLWLPEEDKSNYGSDCFDRLEKALAAAGLCAVRNYNNALFEKNRYELEYVRMRERQCEVLKEMYSNVKSIGTATAQGEIVAGFLGKIERDYHRDNTVEALLAEQEGLLERMRTQPLPASREEFETRALLYHILLQAGVLLEVKRRFAMEFKGSRAWHSGSRELRDAEET